MNPSELVLLLNDDKIISAGFNINSLLLKEQVNLKNYMIPVGLAYREENKKDNATFASNIIDTDLYDKLVDLATNKPSKPKNKTKINKPKKNTKTKKNI